MSDEDESTDPGIIVAAERAILKFLRDREANEAAPEDRGTVHAVKARAYMIGLPLKWFKLKAKGKRTS